MKVLNHLIDLFYPKLCQACLRKLVQHEKVLCTYCRQRLPLTHFHRQKDNPVEVLFWGRCELSAAAARYRYLQEGHVQELIHHFKYKGFQDIGLFIGEQYGYELMSSDRFNDVDYIIPVPLHPKKKRRRGFNQSEVFGRGLEKSMKAKLEAENLYRLVHTSTQTRKSRWERYKNTSSIFGIRDIEKFQGKHLLLVDDVITTGSTIEACAQKLQEIDQVKISVAAIAAAAH